MNYNPAGSSATSGNGNKIPAGGKNKCMDNAKISATIPGETPPSKMQGQSSGSVQHARSGAANKSENMKSMPTKGGAKGFGGEGSSTVKYS